MTKIFTTATAAALLLLTAPALAEEKMPHSGHDKMDHGKMDHSKMDHGGMDHGAMEHKEIAPGTEASGVGVIESVDADKGMVKLTHEPMPDLGWPTMTMDLPVTKQVDLSGIKAGDKIDFKLKLGRDKQYRVIEMAPAQ